MPAKPVYSRSLSCPASCQQNVTLYTDEEGHVNLLQEPSEDERDLFSHRVLKSRSPSCWKKRPYLVMVLVIMVVAISVLLCILLFHHGEDHNIQPSGQSSFRKEPLQKERQQCFHEVKYSINRDFYKGKTEKGGIRVPLTPISQNSSGRFSLSHDGKTLTAHKSGRYEITMEFLMDTYTLDKYSRDNPYMQYMCLNIGSRRMCKQMVIHRRMKIPLQIHTTTRINTGQTIYAFVWDPEMVSSTVGNVVSISFETC